MNLRCDEELVAGLAIERLSTVGCRSNIHDDFEANKVAWNGSIQRYSNNDEMISVLTIL